jgi:hypothetical protein
MQGGVSTVGGSGAEADSEVLKPEAERLMQASSRLRSRIHPLDPNSKEKNPQKIA